MSSPMTALAAHLGAVVTEAMLYGFSVLLFGNTIYAIATKDSCSKFNRITLGIVCSLFILSSAHMVASTYVGAKEFVYGQPYYLISLSSKLPLNIFYTMEVVLADAVVIYRAWIACSKDIRPVLAPMTLWLGVLCTAIGSMIALMVAEFDPITLEPTNDLNNWVIAFISTTLACNLSATGLLIYRIWDVNSAVQPFRIGRGRLGSILRIVMDSAAIYSAALMSQIICVALQSRGQFILLAVLPQIIASTFYLVILRMASLDENDNPSVPPSWPGSLFANDRSSTMARSNIAPIQLAPRVHNHNMGGGGGGIRSLSLSKTTDQSMDDFSSDDPELALGQSKGSVLTSPSS